MEQSQEPTSPSLKAMEEVNEAESLNPQTTPLVEPLNEDGFQRFDPRNISAERTSGLIFTAVVGIGMLVGMTALFFSIGLGWIVYACLAAAALLLVLLLWYTTCWPSVEHRHRSWRLSDVGIELRHGVWWKHRHAIPWARVQHADVTQGPLQRMYGVGTLTVHTAGTANSSVNLGGLSHQVAIDLRDEIIRQRTQGDVV